MPELDSENSFITVEESDDLLDTVHGAEDWASGPTDTQKARLLITATRTLRQLIDPVKVTSDDFWTSEPLKLATALQAWFLYRYAETLETSVKDGLGSIKSKKLGAISAERFGSGLHRLRRYHPQVLELLRGYYTTSKRIVRA